MRLTPEADAEELRAVVAAFLDRQLPIGIRVRDLDRGWNADVWRRFAREVGAAALDLPEAMGGSGATFREVSVVAEELGRTLAPLPWLATSVFGLPALHGRPGFDATVEALICGERTAALAYLDPRGGPAAAAALDAGSWVLTGEKQHVIDGATADVLLVVAQTADGPGLFMVEQAAAGLNRAPLQVMDQTRPLARLTFDRVAARSVVTEPAETEALLDRILTRARVVLACEQLGGAEEAMWMAVRHACDRIQFGQPIATFQAIKHRCADMAVRVEAARSAALWAVASVADDHPDTPLAAAAASTVCAETYRWVSAETIQVHGGIGFTWEYAAHLHFRRAAAGAVLLDEPSGAHDRILDLLGI
ncbi:MAG: hypothetical protein ABS81_05295 [Pseudonocardia sp. SCN 72-86]|nr:MAG: hypothetical protein ABS81_05295 [Pseudonocardia sp. SCN 72-86]